MRKLICPICGLDGFENQDDLDIHLEDCEEIEPYLDGL